MAENIEVWFDWPQWAASRPLERADGTGSPWDGTLTVDAENYRPTEHGVTIGLGSREVLIPWGRVLAVFRPKTEPDQIAYE
jgi:hypothetical protein